jgi:hypothetical protein
MLRKIFLRWLQLATVATALSLIVYVVAQQIGRHAANDPQIQMARDAALLLEGGQTPESVLPVAHVDMSRSLAPFVIVLDDTGKVLARSATLRGAPRAVPQGVLTNVRDHGEERVTWQPEPGVRIASVIERYGGSPGGFVIAGRSLQETEERVVQFQRLILLGWALTLAGLAVVTAVTEYGVGGPDQERKRS